jgi:hypothetical protein
VDLQHASLVQWLPRLARAQSEFLLKVLFLQAAAAEKEGGLRRRASDNTRVCLKVCFVRVNVMCVRVHCVVCRVCANVVLLRPKANNITQSDGEKKQHIQGGSSKQQQGKINNENN